MSVKRKLSIYITGAHCVGKTTLHETLMDNQEFSKFNFKGQKEIAREWIQAKGYTPKMLRDPVLLLQLEYELLYAQLQSENAENSDFDGRFSRFLWDRGIIDSLIYTKTFCEEGAVDNMLMISGVQAALSRLRQNEDTHIFIPKPQKEFIESDGVRRESDLDELLKIHNVTIDTLNELAIPHTVIERANLADRVHMVLNTIKRKWPCLIAHYGMHQS